MTYTLRQGDSSMLLGDMPEHSVDFLLMDPPYNLGRYSTGNIKMSWRKDFNNDIADWDAEPFAPADWLPIFQRVLKPTGNLFAFTNYNLLGDWHRAYDPVFDTFQFMVWHVTNPAPKLHRAGFLNSCQLIVCCWNKGHTWNFSRQNEMHNFLQSGTCAGKERIQDPRHPTQKPVKILSRLVEIASNEGDLVCDPFMGVGSTGIAALTLRRNFLGMELDISYFHAAQQRLSEYK